MLFKIVIRKTGDLFDPFTLGLVYVNFGRPRRDEIRKPGNTVPEHVSPNMIWMIVGDQRACQTHSLVVGALYDTGYVPGWVHNHADAFLFVSDKIDEIGHLRCDIVSFSKIAARQ